MTPEFTFLFVHGSEIGYARAGTYLAEELTKRGVKIWDDDGRPQVEDRGAKQRKVSTGREASPTPTNAICWLSVPTHAGGWFQGQHRSIFTMWESQKLPEDFRQILHEFDLVIVPSMQNVELFSKYHDNVRYVPLGIDPKLWYYREPHQPRQTFDFLISGRGERKGTDIVYKAFTTVFGHWWREVPGADGQPEIEYVGPEGRPTPRLVMKSMKGDGRFWGPWMRPVTGKLTAEAELDLYDAAHCYVQPSRGEGFGLQPLQAIAMGRPTILTNAHGHASYAHLGIPISAANSKADYFIFGDAGEWWEPDFDELCEAMWDVYENYDTHCERAKANAEIVANEWTWANTAEKFLELMGPELEKPYSGDGTWESPKPRLYKIITNTDHTSNAAGITRHFKRGEVYWDIADMKRILFDAGRLSPECLEEDDHGLAPEQIPHLEAYNAAHSACPTCGQVLGSGRMYADELYEELEREALQREMEEQASRVAG